MSILISHEDLNTGKGIQNSPSSSNVSPKALRSANPTARHSEEPSLQAPFHSASFPQGLCNRTNSTHCYINIISLSLAYLKEHIRLLYTVTLYDVITSITK